MIIKILSVLLFVSCSVVGKESVETLKYKVLQKEGKKEIRLYDSYIKAEIEVEGDIENARGEAFKILAGYIFGKNKSKTQIDMTSPVITNKSEKIKMTSPVIMNDESSRKMKMSFSMPSKYTLDTLPAPIDTRIKISQVPEKLIAAIRFSGKFNSKKNMKKSKDLKKWIAGKGKTILNPVYFFAGYNPPYTLPIFRRNEIMYILKK